MFDFKGRFIVPLGFIAGSRIEEDLKPEILYTEVKLEKVGDPDKAEKRISDSSLVTHFLPSTRGDIQSVSGQAGH